MQDTRRKPTGPAIQNIPLRTELGRKLREVVAPREPVVDVDYAELERRILEQTDWKL